ncbi:hypothetical protein DPMN_180929 [Dreissena polymorpha]|uniref:Uncharacterized protein n=1 Tax=Dreissena polymorpha TaxID=45954 RepID=A0A9D4DCQ0_DREPO|nr:hypothetical protein DPMN_180929 [Dreissena polymorpha]
MLRIFRTGFITNKTNTPSMEQMNANNRTTFPQNSYIIPPNGGANKHPNDMNARAIQRALFLSLSSGNRSAIIASPDESANAEPNPWRLLAKNKTA